MHQFGDYPREPPAAGKQAPGAEKSAPAIRRGVRVEAIKAPRQRAPLKNRPRPGAHSLSSLFAPRPGRRAPRMPRGRRRRGRRQIGRRIMGPTTPSHASCPGRKKEVSRFKVSRAPRGRHCSNLLAGDFREDFWREGAGASWLVVGWGNFCVLVLGINT